METREQFYVSVFASHDGRAFTPMELAQVLDSKGDHKYFDTYDEAFKYGLQLSASIYNIVAFKVFKEYKVVR